MESTTTTASLSAEAIARIVLRNINTYLADYLIFEEGTFPLTATQEAAMLEYLTEDNLSQLHAYLASSIDLLDSEEAEAIDSDEFKLRQLRWAISRLQLKVGERKGRKMKRRVKEQSRQLFASLRN